LTLAVRSAKLHSLTHEAWKRGPLGRVKFDPDAGALAPGELQFSAQQYGLPLREALIRALAFLGRARAEDRKLRKELALEVPCFEGTLQRSCFEKPASESHPVAGIIRAKRP